MQQLKIQSKNIYQFCNSVQNNWKKSISYEKKPDYSQYKNAFANHIDYFSSIDEGTPYDGKLSCTVWSGGNFRDNIKELPITIAGGNHLRMFAVYADCAAVYLERRRHLTGSPIFGLYIATILILTNSQFCGIIRSYYKN